MRPITLKASLIGILLVTTSLQNFDSCVNEILEEFHVPGAAVALVVDGEVVLAKGYGSRDLESGLPVTPHTLFCIGSCTKAFTARLLIQLAADGRISLDDPVRKVIPEFALSEEKRAAELTIRDLLAHRTGIARHDPIWFYSEISGPAVLDLLPHLEPVCKVGEEFQYNNFMYAVAGLATERVTGLSWEEALSSMLLEPLEMGETTATLPEGSDFSLPYAEIEGEVREISFREAYAMNPAGGMSSNALDMAKWVQFQLANSCESHQACIEVLKSDERARYGLGWFIGTSRGRTLISHGGDWDGFSSEICLLPDERIGVAILTNSSTDGRFAVLAIRNQILDQLLGVDEGAIEKIREDRRKSKQALEVSLPGAMSPNLTAYTGLYEHPAYGVLTIGVEKGGLVASCGNWTTPLLFKSDHLFLGEWKDLLVYGIPPHIEFQFSPGQSVEIAFEKFRNARPITFTKCPI
jgi:CubicO group peptidase (beta-lactamase class C family)